MSRSSATLNRKSTTHARLCWLRGVLHAYFYQDGARRRVSLKTTDMAVAKERLASFVPPEAPPRYRATAWLYFIQCDCPAGFIKIGTAANVQARLNDIQTSCPYRLVLLGKAPVSAAMERETHRKFAHLRERGEWFRKEPELVEFIQHLTGREHA